MSYTFKFIFLLTIFNNIAFASETNDLKGHYDGHWFLEKCSPAKKSKLSSIDENKFRISECYSFMAGIFQINTLFANNKLINPITCPSQNTSVSVMTEKVLNFYKKNKEDLDYNAVSTIMYVMMQSYPCK